MLIACESAFGDRSDTFAPELAKLAQAPVCGATKTVWNNDQRGGGSGTPSVYGEVHIGQGPNRPELVKRDGNAPGHMTWYDPSGNVIRPPGWTPLYPERGYPAEVDVKCPNYVQDHMTKYWKEHPPTASAKKEQTTDEKRKK